MGIGQFKSQHNYCSLYAECKTVLKLFNMLKENVDWMEDRLSMGSHVACVYTSPSIT